MRLTTRSEKNPLETPRPWRMSAWATVLLSTMIAVFSGCSGGSKPKNTAHLKGKITLDGEPIPGDARASITFKPTRSGQARSTFASIVDGDYDSPHTPQGAVKVYLAISQPTGKMVSEEGGAPYAEVRNLVPPRFLKGIDLEVDADNLDQNFDLAP